MNKAIYLVIPVLCLALSACSTMTYSKGPVVKAQTVLLLQPSSMQKALSDAGKPIYQSLKKALEEKHFTVIDTSDETYQQAVNYALTQAGAIYNPAVAQFKPMDRQKYLHSLIDWYHKKQPFDVCIEPELIVRVAKVEKGQAQWDDVKRRIELTQKANNRYQELHNVRGISLKLSAYSNQAVGIVQSYAGIALPFTLDFTQQPIVYNLKQPLYSEKEQTQAVKKALDPIFHQVKYYEQ